MDLRPQVVLLYGVCLNDLDQQSCASFFTYCLHRAPGWSPSLNQGSPKSGEKQLMTGQTLERLLLLGLGLWVMAHLESPWDHTHTALWEKQGLAGGSDSWPAFLQVLLDAILQVTNLVFILTASGG